MGTILVVGMASAAHGAIVYDNTQNSLNQFYQSDAEFGDEIALEGSERVMTEFAFETFASGIPSEAQGVLRFYANDGAAVDSATAPGSLLFESSAFPLNFGTETHTLSGISVDVPDTFTWTVEFSGLGSGQAGLTLSDPPEVGGSFDDFWVRENGGWSTFRFPNGDPAGNFSAQVTAVPEPSSILFGLVGGLALVGYRFWNRRRSA